MNPLAEIAKLRAENLALREELAEWQRDGRDNTADVPRYEACKRLWDLSRSESAMLLRILDKAPKVQSRDRLLFTRPEVREEFPDTKMVDIRVCRIRRRLEACGYRRDVIRTAWGVGFYAPPRNAVALLTAIRSTIEQEAA